MAELIELSPEAHGDLKVDTQKAISIAKNTHIMTMRVTEVSRAACEMPMFFTKTNDEGDLIISAMTSLELDRNLLVRDDQWKGIYQPTSMATYPFFLMRRPENNEEITVGIDPENSAFSTEKGEPLFEDNKKAGALLSRVTAMLQDDMRNDVHTYNFAKKVAELGLIRSIDVSVGYEGGKVNTLKGLNTIDEAKLAELSEEQFKELREKNYLAPIYSMLISLYQLNHLIRLHNDSGVGDRIQQVTMGVEKDENAAA